MGAGEKIWSSAWFEATWEGYPKAHIPKLIAAERATMPLLVFPARAAAGP